VIAIVNRLPVKEGATGKVVERFAASRGEVQDFPGFVSMEVLASEEAREVVVLTRWRDRAAFDAWVHSDAFSRAHGKGGGSGLLEGHPRMDAYEVAVERSAGGNPQGLA
jgi:heme-degrading monooxygenase HmoA